MEDLVQFPSHSGMLGQLLRSVSMDYLLKFALLSFSSPSEARVLSDSTSPSTRGINDSIVFRQAIVCWENHEYTGKCGMSGMGHTSQCLRIAESPPATDLRGGKASEDSFTRLMASLVVAYTVEPQFDLLSYPGLGSIVWSGVFGRLASLWSLPGVNMNWSGTESGSSLSEQSAVRWITWNIVSCVLLDSRIREVKGVDVGRVEAPALRSGADSVGRVATRSVLLGPLREPTSL